MAVKKQKISDIEQEETVSSGVRFSFRLTNEEASRMEQLQQRLQIRLGKYARVTQRVLVLEALEALELRMNTLDAKKKRGDE